MGPVARLVQKELRQIRRDPMIVRMILVMPIVQLLVLGYAVSLDLKGVRVSVLDEANSAASRRLVEAVLACETFVPGPAVASTDEIQFRLQHGTTDLALHVPVDHGRASLGETAELGVAIDGRNSAQAGQAAGQLAELVALQASREAAHMPGAWRPTPGRATLKPLHLYNPELKSRFNMVPGIVVLLITVLSAMLVGMTVVRERELGTLEQLRVTPLKPWQLALGKTLPLALVCYGELALATVFAVFWFRLPLVGSVPLLALAVLLYLLTTLGGGLLASTVSRTQQQAVFTVWFFLVFGILLSGFFFPVANMPPALHWITFANPMRWILEVVRGIFLKGSGLADLWPQFAALAAIGSASYGAALWRFRRLGD